VKVFATGGIGGVHRGGHVSLDISSDLTELARSRMLVVCAGIKSILDIPRTLEVLETYGVTVAAFNTPHVPAFYSRSSGVPAPVVVRDAAGAAELLLTQEALGLRSSILIGVPPPQDDTGDAAAIEDAITLALSEARAQSIKGPQETPFLLQRVSELTGSRSLAANVALYINNASVAADIACAHAIEAARRRAIPSKLAASLSSLSRTHVPSTTYSKVISFIFFKLPRIFIDVSSPCNPGRLQCHHQHPTGVKGEEQSH
jgi:pseudouridine-5'-phosphate glycosidase